MTPLSDSHAHLGTRDFQSDYHQVIERAKQAEVGLIANCTDTLDDFDHTLKIKREYPDLCLCCLGLHPDSIPQGEAAFREGLARMETDVDLMDAVGEVGLDYHYGVGEENHRIQRYILETMCDFASGHHLPIVIHCREAGEDLLRILESKKLGKIYLHCYEEGLEFAENLLARGYDCIFGFNGIITFKNAESLRQTAAKLPLERIVTETDSPCLAPVPFRGRRNEPAYVGQVAEKLAQIRGVDIEEIRRLTMASARRFYGRG